MSEEAKPQEAQVEEQQPVTEEVPQETANPNDIDPFAAQPDALLDEADADPFAELMEADPQETELPVEPAGEQKTEEVQQANPDAPKEDQNQYQYWQSQADIRSKELSDVLQNFGVESVDELQAKYGDIQDIAPIARYVKSNPSVLDNVEASLSNGQAQGQPQGDQEPSLKQPEKPTKPSNYDALDAYSDPNSDSFKYNEAMDEYRDQMIDYSRLENESLKNQMVQEREVQKRQQEDVKLRSDLHTKYDMPPEEVDRFVNYMSSPESVSVDNLVALWKTQQNPTASAPTQAPQAHAEGQVAPDPTVEAMKRQREKLSMPQPVSVTPGGEQGADKSPESTVMDAMISDYKKQNPW